jgi:hypothetical protein
MAWFIEMPANACRVAKVGTLSEDRQCLRQAQRGRVEALQTPADLRLDAVDAADRDEVLERAQLARVSGSLEGAEEFPKAKGISSRGAVREDADVVAHGYAAGAQDRRHSLGAQQGRANHPRSRAHGGQRSRAGCGFLGSQRPDECNARSVEARRKVGEPAQRRLVGPMRVVDRQQQRRSVGEVDRQPVEAVQDREALVLLEATRVVALKQRGDRAGRAGEQCDSLVRAGVGAAALEELPRDAEGEVAFEVGPAGPEHEVPVPAGDLAGGVEQRGFADSGPRFDRYDSAAAHAALDFRHLGVALDEVGHRDDAAFATRAQTATSDFFARARLERNVGGRW